MPLSTVFSGNKPAGPAALQRAAQKARKTAKDTSTPLVIYKDGQVIMQTVEDEKPKE